jgi:uncharacterized membrane protein
MTKMSIERLEQILGLLLGIGVKASSVCLTAGLLMTFVGGHQTIARALLTAGIVVLLATPVARVGASTVGYASRRDWLFVTLTLVVFIELLATIFAALTRT